MFSQVIFAANQAASHQGRHLKVLTSFYIDFYIRIAFICDTKSLIPLSLLESTGIVLECDGCEAFEVLPLERKSHNSQSIESENGTILNIKQKNISDSIQNSELNNQEVNNQENNELLDQKSSQRKNKIQVNKGVPISNISNNIIRNSEGACIFCNNTINFTGPIYLYRLYDPEFIQDLDSIISNDMISNTLVLRNYLQSLILLAKQEIDLNPLYYNFTIISRLFRLEGCKIKHIR